MESKILRFILVIALSFLSFCACAKSASEEETAGTDLTSASATQSPTPTIAPTAVPTPSATPAPTPITMEMIDSGVFDSYFEDTVFVGDSITTTLRNYCTAQRKTNPEFLGGAKFLAAVSLSVRTAKSNYPGAGVDLQYRGSKIAVPAGLAAMEAKRVFILLGVNDYAAKNPESTLKNYNTLLDNIYAENPNIEIVIQGILPVTVEFCLQKGINIDKWNAYNETLIAMCEERGIKYLSFAEDLMDENGYLRRDYSSDGLFHLSTTANEIWVRALRTYAAEQVSEAEIISALAPSESALQNDSVN